MGKHIMCLKLQQFWNETSVSADLSSLSEVHEKEILSISVFICSYLRSDNEKWFRIIRYN